MRRILMHKMKYRSRTEIICDILQTASGDGNVASQTKIMYAVYLSSGSLREYLTALTVHVLLIYDPTMCTYQITERGIRFLELYNKLGDMTAEQEEELEFSHTG